jgi:hypothetical protein
MEFFGMPQAGEGVAGLAGVAAGEAAAGIATGSTVW